MGKFTDTKYINTINNLVEANKSKLTNPYYILNDKQPTVVTYYSQNIEKSTIDQASGLYEAHIGDGSPFRFNKVEEFVIYGIDRISTELDVGDYGIEVEGITGNAIILPNTINPRPGDFFTISHVKEPILFKVTAVSTDTLDTGANIYQVDYSFASINKVDEINKQVEKVFKFIAGNVGTDFKAVIQDTDFDLIANLEALVEELIISFYNIFFDERLQTFVYNHDGWYMYDPYLIEFFIRNKVMDYGNSYLFVSHATTTNRTFGMDYMRTFFHWLEDPISTTRYSTTATADLISDPNSLFMTRLEYYYCVRYQDNTPYKTRFTTISQDVIDHINSGELYEKGNINEFYNLWISFFKNDKEFIRGDVVAIIKNADYMDNLECFYSLAITIYILEQYIAKLLK